MTNEQAIETLRELNVTEVSENQSADIYAANVDKYLEALDMAISALVRDRWISVEERLPEEKGTYEIAYHPCYWDDVDHSKIKIGTDTFLGKTKWAKRKYRRVTHWRPLPEIGDIDGT